MNPSEATSVHAEDGVKETLCKQMQWKQGRCTKAQIESPCLRGQI